MALINRLISDHDPLEKFLEKYELKMYQGYISGNRARKVPPELHKFKCLAGGGMPSFEFDVDELPLFTEKLLETLVSQQYTKAHLFFVQVASVEIESLLRCVARTLCIRVPNLAFP